MSQSTQAAVVCLNIILLCFAWLLLNDDNKRFLVAYLASLQVELPLRFLWVTIKMLVNKGKYVRVQVQRRRANVAQVAQRTRNSWAYCPEPINHTYNDVNSVVKCDKAPEKIPHMQTYIHTYVWYICTCVYMYHLVPVLPADWRKYWQQGPRNLKRTDHNKSRLLSGASRAPGEWRKGKGEWKVEEMCMAEMLVKLKHFTCPDVDKLEVFEVWELPFAMSCTIPPVTQLRHHPLLVLLHFLHYTLESICSANFYNEANVLADYRLNK